MQTNSSDQMSCRIKSIVIFSGDSGLPIFPGQPEMRRTENNEDTEMRNRSVKTENVDGLRSNEQKMRMKSTVLAQKMRKMFTVSTRKKDDFYLKRN
jgi:hypothetical protein